MSGELGTTNLLLGIMAAVSVLEALVIIGMGVAGFRAYRKVMVFVDGIETRQVAPAMARVNVILDDVKTMTAKVKEETERVDHAIHTTMDRIDDAADRMRSNVRAKTGAVVGLVRGLRVAIDEMLHSRHRSQAREGYRKVTENAGQWAEKGKEAAGEWAEHGKDMYGEAREAVSRGAEEAQKYVRDAAGTVTGANPARVAEPTGHGV